MRVFLLALFFTGLILVVTNSLIKARSQPPRVVYRYLPRDLDTFLREQPQATANFSTMFTGNEVNGLVR